MRMENVGIGCGEILYLLCGLEEEVGGGEARWEVGGGEVVGGGRWKRR